MAVYPAHRSVLVIEPIGLTNEDFTLLRMEDADSILSYFISTNDDPPKFKSKIYEDPRPQGIYPKMEVFVDGSHRTECFGFHGRLKNTAWAAEQAQCSIDAILYNIQKNRINVIRSKNEKYFLIVLDKKWDNFLKERLKMNSNASSVSAPVNASVSAPRFNFSDMISHVIKAGHVGGQGDSVTALDLQPHLVNIYPHVAWNRGKINAGLKTLLTHGDVVRVPILDRFGNPTKSFARGKYHINTKAAVNHPAVPHPAVPHPAVGSVSVPAAASTPVTVNQISSSSLNVDKIAEEMIKQGIPFSKVSEIIGKL